VIETERIQPLGRTMTGALVLALVASVTEIEETIGTGTVVVTAVAFLEELPMMVQMIGEAAQPVRRPPVSVHVCS